MADSTTTKSRLERIIRIRVTRQIGDKSNAFEITDNTRPWVDPEYWQLLHDLDMDIPSFNMEIKKMLKVQLHELLLSHKKKPNKIKFNFALELDKS
jgi:hypothetical protein